MDTLQTLSRCVNIRESKIYGMKTHDCHVLLERILSLFICDLLSRHMSNVLIELSHFLKDLCSKVLRVEGLDKLEHEIPLILCKLKKIYPPIFFDIIEHLPIHLPWKAKVGGPIQYQWMYPIERQS